MSAVNESYLCPKCTKNVNGNHKSIGCGACGTFYHASCLKVTKDVHSFLYRNKMFSFTCSKCSDGHDACSTGEESLEIHNQVQNVTNNDPANNICTELRNCFLELSSSLEQQHQAHISEYEKQLQNALQVLQTKVNDIIVAVRTEYTDKVNKLQSEVQSSCGILNQVDVKHTNKINDLENQINVFQRRQNRANILVKGLPHGIKNLREPIVKIGSICNIQLSPLDINHCCYISSGNSVLVKFNSVHIRDCIMVNFSKLSNPILANNVTKENINNRIFLNDHLLPNAANLMYTCRKLCNEKIIQSFKLINGDKPIVAVIFNNGSERFLEIQQCIDLLEESPGISASAVITNNLNRSS